ncbi:MAG: shikimate dehydrogenase [Duncaniella sp.]|nr:shikimate dehydrogenase [Duncaniella sp.]
MNSHKRFGLIGYPLGHSFSRKYFNEKFAVEGIDAEYCNFEIPSITELTDIIAKYPYLAGLNVTIPYKQQVIPYLDSLDDEAAAIGAVNVIKVIRDTQDKNKVKLVGYNSDVIGFRESIAPFITGERKKALILGTGGASKAVYHGLKSLGVEPVFVSRTPREGMLSYGQLTPEVMAERKVIVNSTPVGTYPDVDSFPDIPYGYLTPEHLLYDLVYNPELTSFLKKGAEHGATIKNGHEMLELQAIGAWNIWNK